MIAIEPWVTGVLADPVSRQPVTPEHFPHRSGVLDVRVFLRHTHGYSTWAEGQVEFERWAESDPASERRYRDEIKCDRPVYDRFALRGRILDCGGASGTVREFLPDGVEFISTDPWL